MATETCTIVLNKRTPALDIEIVTPTGTYRISGGLSQRKDNALVLDIDTEDFEATPDRLRIAVNDGDVFNYGDATSWYGEDQGAPAPESSR